MKRRYLTLLFILCILSACNWNIVFVGDDEEYTTVTAAEEIRLKAYYAAEYYLEDGMEYELGGDDEIYIPSYDTRGIDCSGLVINCYEFAVEDTDYELPFADATANDMYQNYTEDVTEPEEGDLIFWVYDSGTAYHVALYEKTETGKYYFIESNEFDDVDGLNYRSLSVNSIYNIEIKRLILIDNS